MEKNAPWLSPVLGLEPLSLRDIVCPGRCPSLQLGWALPHHTPGQNRIPPFSSTLGSSGIFPALSLATLPTHCFPLSWPKAQLDPVVLDVPVTLDTPP